ncbi:16S rRNA (uracil(1498)-N(3))-methyltransferase [Ramlibacter rhizophilus]|uniref:Ribosomal RNA small subunit methyltransferase E n=1 Tax=Ramlibacter rhizophilus TaxID=1781167 RepID=A0A4Z0BIC0_9BURK|nr:16S rRNA (uracil(1498)-N(3))-methyltransferase [Ramlibacter rhizophilus]TFY98149.1 16S rRNA (uracil(1498)-N(3))-methyltransferase [Ramlibacter rhizophilus]
MFTPGPLESGRSLALGDGAARHVQVLRLQPGDGLVLFDGRGGEWDATVERMGRSEVQVRVGAHRATEREALRAVHLALGVPANERMDWLVEKAAELGAASLTPLTAQRSVLRLSGERAERRQAHWQAIATAACEQCGRNRVPAVEPLQSLGAWCAALPAGGGRRLLLSLDADARPIGHFTADEGPVLLLSGPEGGLAPAEIEAAQAQGFEAVSLGARTLRAETAPLAALAVLTLAGATRSDTRCA